MNVYAYEIGDEIHYVLICKYFNTQRKQFIKPHFRGRPNIVKFHFLMNQKNTLIIKNLMDVSL